MQLNKTLSLFVVIVFASSCVQKTLKKTVVFELDTSKIKSIKTVGIRGENRPLKWNRSIDMKSVKPDTTYTATLTFLTGYKFVEMKFLVNDEFELKDDDNRRIYFSDKDTIYYRAVFDKK